MNPNVKFNLITLGLVVSLGTVALGMGAKNPDGANTPHFDSASPQPSSDGGGPRFIMSLCIGNILGQEGVAFPIPQPNQKPTLDETLKKQFDAAAETCKSQLEQAGWKVQSKPAEQQ